MRTTNKATAYEKHLKTNFDRDGENLSRIQKNRYKRLCYSKRYCIFVYLNVYEDKSETIYLVRYISNNYVIAQYLKKKGTDVAQPDRALEFNREI